MAQQDLIKIHNVKTFGQQIAPHEDLVGMLQLVRDERKITMITKETGGNAKMIEMLLIQHDELEESGIYGLHSEDNKIMPYRITAPSVDAAPEAPIEQARNTGTGIIVTESKHPPEDDPKNWSARYHAELDRTVVRQTNLPEDQHNAVIIEHDLEGITPQTPVNFAVEPLIRGNDIQYYKAGSGALTIQLQQNDGMYRVQQENVRSNGAQDNHVFSIPIIVAVKDIPDSDEDAPAVELVYDPNSSTATQIKLNEYIKRAIMQSFQNITAELSFDGSDRADERLSLKLTIARADAETITREVSVHIPVTDWGEIAGNIAEQTDLQDAFDAKADKITTEEGTLNLSDVREQIGTDIADHNEAEDAHDDIRQKIGTDIAAHNEAEYAHNDIRIGAATAVSAHNGDISAHPNMQVALNNAAKQNVDAHNASNTAHSDIRQAIIDTINTHNFDALEDQHPLIRALIAEQNDSFQNHTVNTGNPHEVTAEQVGLGDVDNTPDIEKEVLSATKLTTARTIALTGAVSGSADFSGEENISIDAELAGKAVQVLTAAENNSVSFSLPLGNSGGPNHAVVFYTSGDESGVAAGVAIFYETLNSISGAVLAGAVPYSISDNTVTIQSASAENQRGTTVTYWVSG
jgi:hypothetical protein